MPLSDPDEVEGLRHARSHVLDAIAEAARQAGRDPGDVALLAITKTVPVERIRAAVAAGLSLIGENRVQEAEAKVGEVEGATWHLVGPLQSNKVRRALATFGAIESVDSPELAERIDRLAAEARPGKPIPVHLQVNVDGDAAKSGFQPAALEASVGRILELERLDVRGLMTIGRLVERAEDARPTFIRLRELSERLRARHPGLGSELSMGMSDDYAVAVEEGATTVRIGRALFGHHH